MAKDSSIQLRTIGDGDVSNTTQRIRKRDKFLGFLGLPKSKSKDLKNTTTSHVLNSQASPKAAGVHFVVSQSCDNPLDNNHSLAPMTFVDKPLPTLSTEITRISGIFPENVPKPAIETELPDLQDRIEVTQQLVYCNRLIIDGQSILLSAGSAATKRPSNAPVNKESGTATDTQESDDNGLLERKVNEAERSWIKVNGQDPIQQEHLRWLVAKVVEEFAKDDLKGHAVIAEVVILGPVLERGTYRSLLSCFIAKFERDNILDVVLVQGIVQLIEGASPGHLEDDDLVRTLAVLRQRLQGTHKPSSEHVFQITIAISRLLDVMVNNMVKDVNRNDDHQPLVAALMELKDNTDPILKFQIEYALQALQYIPDDESTLQAVLRFAGGFTMAVLGVASVCKLDPANLFSSLETLRQAAGQAHEVTKSILEGMEASQRGRFGAMQSLLHGIRKGNKHEWYLVLLAAKTFVREGRLAEFNQVVCEAYCRDERAFQLGVCQILGEIAMGPLWDILTRQHAVDFLGAQFRSAAGWKQHVDVKEWIFVILTQLSVSQDAVLMDHSNAVLQDLMQGFATATSITTISYSLKTRLPLPESSPLLTRVQMIPYLEYELHKFRLQRLEESRQRIYIPPMAKLSLQAPDDSFFPLMDKIQEFLATDREVMLILGDSGAGKSTFNKHLEHRLWTSYIKSDRIPLHINLPAIRDPEEDMITKQLLMHNFKDDQILEMKQHRQLILICDGYDESQLTANLHKTNRLNQHDQWQVKMIISCRTQFLGPIYENRFVPQVGDHYQRPALDLFQEAVITPFSEQQVKDYVTRYVPLEPRPWVTEDYMSMLTIIPNLMDLVKNPFLLSLALEALPGVTKGQKDLSNIKITRVQLYDYFVNEWLDVNMRRLQNSTLTKEDRNTLNELVDEGFLYLGGDYSTRLAVAIFDKQDGNPVVQYIPRQDKDSWKADFFGTAPESRLLRESSPLTRTGNQYRFVHRSVLEYYFSRVIYDPAKKDVEEFDLQVNAISSTVQLLNTSSPLFQRNLLKEPSVIQFLCDRVKLNPSFEQELRNVVNLSKTDSSVATAATNAITILVRAGARFHGADLRGVKISGADLSDGQFDSAQFQGADLTDVILSRSWLRQADLSGARLEGFRFGELPYLGMHDPVQACTYSPDGRMLAVGVGEDGFSIYDTSTWTFIRRFTSDSEVKDIAFSPNNQQIITAESRGDLQTWDCTSGKEVLALSGHTMTVLSAAFSPCGKQIASASGDGTVRLWNSLTGESLFVLQGHDKAVVSVKYSPDGRQLVSGGEDGTIRFWNPQTGELSAVLSTSLGRVFCLSYSPDGRWIASGHSNGVVQLWNAATREPGPVLKGHSYFITGIAFSPSGQWIASSGYDETVRLWDANSGTLLSVWTGHAGLVECVAFSPDGFQVASGGDDMKVRLWEVDSAWSSLDPRDGGRVDRIAYTPDGRTILAFLSSSRVLRRWDAGAGVSSDSLPLELAEPQEVSCMVFSPNGSQFAVGYENGSIHLWDYQTSTAGPILKGHSSQVCILVYSPCYRWLASVDTNTSVRLWDLHNTEQHHTLVEADGDLKVEVSIVVFSPTGDQLALGGGLSYTTVCLFDLPSMKLLSCNRLAEEGILWSMVYSPHGRQIAFVAYDSIYLWDLQSEKPGAKLNEHTGWIMCIAYSSCGQWIASSSSDKTVGIWYRQLTGKVENWSRVHSICSFFGSVDKVAWNPLFHMEFVTGCLDGSTRVWRLSSDEGGNVVVKMLWGSNLGVLCAEGLTLKNATGLSPVNQKLLVQRGAVTPFTN